MRSLKSVTVYFTPEEYARVKDEADDNGVTVSALLRAKAGFRVTLRGAPKGNRNRATVGTSGSPGEPQGRSKTKVKRAR